MLYPVHSKAFLKRRRTRYYLHHKVRKQGFTLITKSKTIYHPFHIDPKASKQLQRLINEFGYVVQLTL